MKNLTLTEIFDQFIRMFDLGVCEAGFESGARRGKVSSDSIKTYIRNDEIKFCAYPSADGHRVEVAVELTSSALTPSKLELSRTADSVAEALIALFDTLPALAAERGSFLGDGVHEWPIFVKRAQQVIQQRIINFMDKETDLDAVGGKHPGVTR